MARKLRVTVGPEVVEVPLAELHPWEENPRSISPRRLQDLKRSLVADREMLFVRPLFALPDGTVFFGNQRLRAARELGWATLPTIRADIDRDLARTWALRDNIVYGDWDEPALAELLAELTANGVDLALIGFESADIDRLLAGLEAPPDQDDLPPLPSGAPESKPGVVYELGQHRLLCGDARSQDDVNILMGGDRCELVVTDPPFGVDYVGKTADALTIDNDNADGLRPLLGEAFAVVDRVLNPGGRLYVFSPAGPLGTVFRLAVEEVGWQLHQTLVWAKDAFVLGHSDYHYAHEDLLYAWKPGAGRVGRGRHKTSRWQGGNDQGSVLFCDRPKRSPDHPTCKPVELLTRLITNSSRRGDLVLDPFAGSGSTLIASELLGRRCFAVEIDPRYCDLIRRRYQEFTGGR